ncbi:MAG: hypothetical protein GY842_12805 [bacterium]|nr:hypothetical protein [bacterium]
MERSVHSTVATTLRLFVLTLPMALLGSHFGGFTGLLVGVVCGEILASIFIMVWLRHTLRPAEHSPPAPRDLAAITTA